MNDTKQDLLDYLKNVNIERDLSNIDMFSTISIADGFHISRSLASQYLNSLYREGQLVKIDNRPVYYINRFVFERDFDVLLDSLCFSSLNDLIEYISSQKKTKYSFENLIGFDGILGETISQIKSAVSYPNASGLNYLLYGEVGVGKSTLSKCAYEYLVEQKDKFVKRVICDGLNANFIKCFCDCVREAKDGIVVIKRGNYISSEDKKILSRILENRYFIGNQGKKEFVSCSLVMLYDKTSISDLGMLLDFFPIKCFVPNFIDRYSIEKERIIIRFFKDEAHILSKNIEISYALIKYLLNTNFTHNLDDLKNIIKEICARANIEADTNLRIGVNHLPERLTNTGNAVTENEFKTSLEWIDVNNYIQPDASQGIINLFNNIIKVFGDEDLNVHACIKECSILLNKFYDECIYDNNFNSEFTFSYNMKFEDVINSVVYTYNYIVPEHCSTILSYYSYVKKTVSKKIHDWYVNNQYELKNINQILSASSSEINVLIERIKLAFSYNINVSLDDTAVLILYILFLNYNSLNKNRQFISMIICHGVSTAYSISNMVNNTVGQHIFEYIDMPLDKTMADVADYVSKYIKRFNIKSDILLLVDMGSLEELGTHLQKVENNIYVLNNVSTPMALSVATMVMQNESVSMIQSECNKYFCSSFKACENKKKKDALVFVSDTSKNMALRIKDTFVSSLPKHIDVQIFISDKMEMEMTNLLEKIRKDYNILFVLGASSVEDEPSYISIESLVKEEELDKITVLLESYLSREEILLFRENLIYNFSLQSIIDNLSVLDAKKVLFYTKNAVNLLQKELHYNFSSNTLPGIYIHICFMVERLVTKEPISSNSDDEEFELIHKDFINVAKKCFRSLCSHYGINLTTEEIQYLYEYIEDDRRKKDE